ncbi:uncharacterized protein LTR77_010848 [Saxophila tyrrhenica]|uniref:Actin-like ATPase domain-containing protein n=1 Tax=Saxophila tyrrhenica TaxID=1690608 RepID=A0AAV9NUC8_9PEZI|nr:hypothetical protein LTR77_010848 [Saxophila tyrrhenica]
MADDWVLNSLESEAPSHQDSPQRPATPVRRRESSKLDRRRFSRRLPVKSPEPGPPSDPIQSAGNARLVLAIDYGTTFTGFGHATTYSDSANLADLSVLQDWSPTMSNLQKVPSVISFARATNGEVDWGADIGDEATTMVNTKLELEPQESLFDELELTLQVLKGTGSLSFEHMLNAGPNPAYTWKPPTKIVAEYLTKIFESARRVVDINQLAVTKTPVDIVVTVPVDWSYEAKNSVFSAIRDAGFNRDNFTTLKDMILVSEPEAASHFTARDLRGRSEKLMQVGDSFIICDAGGGGKFGSAWIDTAFKSWLRDEIGWDNYAQLDRVNAWTQRISPHTGENGPMRELMRRFREKKVVFPNPTEADIKLDLPSPLNSLTIGKRVVGGELTIRRKEMKELMNSCVNGVIELIKDQISKVNPNQGTRVKNVILVGGFGASPYLQDELRKSLALRGIAMRRPSEDKSKSRHKTVKHMYAMKRSYGVRMGSRFEWLVRKGDLVVSDETRIVHSQTFWYTLNDKVDHADFNIYWYNRDDDNPPDVWEEGFSGTYILCNATSSFTDPASNSRGEICWRCQV